MSRKVSYCAEAGEAFIANISLNWINAFDDHIETDVKFLIVDQKWIFNVALD